MTELNIQPGKAFVTCNNKTAYIHDRTIVGFVGFVSGQGLKIYEWLNDATNVGDRFFDLMEEVQIEIINPKGFKFWKDECLMYYDGELLWPCILQWARLMEQKIKNGHRVIADDLAREAGLFEHHKGELAITILYQCWEYGQILERCADYRRYCTLGTLE